MTKGKRDDWDENYLNVTLLLNQISELLKKILRY